MTPLGQGCVPGQHLNPSPNPISLSARVLSSDALLKSQPVWNMMGHS